MSKITVNISDFRCRTAFHGSAQANRHQHRNDTSGMFVVREQVAGFEQEMESSVSAPTAPEAMVVDIASARESHRLVHRSAIRPLTIHRRAKVLHFTNDVEVRKVMRAESQRFQTSPIRTESPDLPPAA